MENSVHPLLDIANLVQRALPKPLMVPEVPESDELLRIVALSRRPQEPPGGLRTTEGDRFCSDFSNLFARIPPGHPNRLTFRAVQAWALSELSEVGGLLGNIPVGEGKTLITYLAPTMVLAKRPMLLIPANLREKTSRDFAKLHLQVYGPNPNEYRIESYQRASTMGAANLFNDYQPDIVIADECQHLRNPRSAVTRRLRRYMDDNPNARFVGLSGTITKRSILDYYLLVGWALRHFSPLPRTWVDCAPWANAVDEKPTMGRRVLPGALKRLAVTPAEFLPMVKGTPEQKVAASRAVYANRLNQTKGVIAFHPTIDIGLTISALDENSYPLDSRDGADDHWLKFRNDWELPDGQMMIDPLEASRHARELALGFYYRWTKQPPEEWREARKAWGKFVRATLKHSHHLDTEAQVIRAIQSEKGSFAARKEGAAVLAIWQAIKPTFVPITEPCWFSEIALKHCAKWMELHPKGIVWVEHQAFGDRLSQMTRSAFYRQGGKDSVGRFIDDHPPGLTMIASMGSNRTGRNLQPWDSNLLTAPPFTGKDLEQLLGRTHRGGQEADTVSAEFVVNCWEHINTFWKSVRDCEYTEGTTQIRQRVSMAVIDMPDLDDIEDRHGARWCR